MRKILFVCILISFVAIAAMGQERSALFVGISDYPESSGFKKIHGANDYEIVGKMLDNKGFKTTTLLNSQATAANIRSQLQNLATNSAKGSYVYIHFSCHGQPFEDKPPFDEDDRCDESLVAYDAKINYNSGVYEGKNHIIDDELYSYFTAIRQKIGENGLLCVVIDACYSGSGSRDEEDDEGIERGTRLGFSENGKYFAPRIDRTSKFAIEKIPGGADIIVLEACRAYQINHEVIKNGRYCGALSFYITQVLKNQHITKNADWILQLRDLMASDPALIEQNMVYEVSF
ncbi:MAG: caspase family protein [Bacteroidales bacterium]|nr:caspase family protein [Bacteroidales bacterium]